MCDDYELSFVAMYSAVGIFNALFLTIYSFAGLSESLIRWCTRFVQEVFAMFIVCALITDAGSDLMKSKF